MDRTTHTLTLRYAHINRSTKVTRTRQPLLLHEMLMTALLQDTHTQYTHYAQANKLKHKSHSQASGGQGVPGPPLAKRILMK